MCVCVCVCVCKYWPIYREMHSYMQVCGCMYASMYMREWLQMYVVVNLHGRFLMKLYFSLEFNETIFHDYAYLAVCKFKKKTDVTSQRIS